MLLKFFTTYPYVVYSIITWGLIILILGFKAIKRLYPAAILGGIMIFCANYWLTVAGLYKFNANFLAILGIPFFHMVWGAGNGIIFTYFFGEKIYQRFLSILVFAGLAVGLEAILEYLKCVEHMGRFNNLLEYFYDVIVLTAFSFIIVSLMKNRLRKTT